MPIPHDCRDGFLMAYWRRPEAYLDPAVRANISVFALLPAAEVGGDGRVAAGRSGERRVGASATPTCSSATRSTWATACSSRNDGTARRLRRRRAAAQLLAGGTRAPARRVAHLLAVQAQDLRAARLALRARGAAGRAADVDAALADGRSS